MFDTVSQMFKPRLERKHLKFIPTRIKARKITHKKGLHSQGPVGPSTGCQWTISQIPNSIKTHWQEQPCYVWMQNQQRGALLVLRKKKNKPKICFMEMIVPPYLESGHYNHRFSIISSINKKRQVDEQNTNIWFAYPERKFYFNPSHFGKQKEQDMLLLEMALKMSMGHRITCPRSIMLSVKTSGSGGRKKKLVSSLSLEEYQPHNISRVNNSLTFKGNFLNEEIRSISTEQFTFKKISTTL